MNTILASRLADKVTAEHIETYRRDGAVCIRQLIEPEWIDHMRDAVEWAIEAAKGKIASGPTPNAAPRDIAAEAGVPGYFHNEASLWRNHPGFMEFITQTPLSEVAAKLTRSEHIRLYNDHLLVKEPGTDAPTPWHQDGTYFRVTGDQIVTAWIGLDPVRRETGAVGFVKASHADGRMYRPVAFATGKTRDSEAFDGPMPDIEGNPEKYETFFFDLEPGDVTFHHGLSIHGGAGNLSTSRRRGYAIRFCGDEVRYADRPWTAYEIGAGLKDGEPIEGHPDFPQIWPLGA